MIKELSTDMILQSFFIELAAITNLSSAEVEAHVHRMTAHVKARHGYNLKEQVKLYPKELTAIFTQAITAAKQGKDLCD